MFCAKCGQSLLEGSQFCQKCGNPVAPVQVQVQSSFPTPKKKPSKIIIFGGGFVGFCFLLAIVASFLPKNAGPQQPGDEASFLSTMKSFEDNFSTAGENEVKQDQIRKQRRDALAQMMRQRKVTGWLGTVEDVGTSENGNASLKVSLGNNVYVKTNNNMVSDGLQIVLDPQLGPSMIKENSDLYKTLAGMKSSDTVIFSGSFYPDEKDFIQEISVTTSGSMDEPEFIFKFSSLQVVAHND